MPQPDLQSHGGAVRGEVIDSSEVVDFSKEKQMNMPIIRFEIQGMQHTLSVALSEHIAKMDTDIQEAIKRACTPKYIQQIIDEEVRNNLDIVMRDSIRNFFTRGEGRKTIADAMMTKIKWQLGMLKYDEEGNVVDA